MRLRTAASVSAYVGGILLLSSMLLPWPWLGRRGQSDGLRMMARVDRAMQQFDVPYGRLISAAWLAMPLCGALLMILVSHGARIAHRVALFGSLVALGETLLLMSAYYRIGLDPWAGRGLVVAMIGAALAVIGTTVACLPHSAPTRRSSSRPPDPTRPPPATEAGPQVAAPSENMDA